jgi:hypothetical protein
MKVLLGIFIGVVLSFAVVWFVVTYPQFILALIGGGFQFRVLDSGSVNPTPLGGTGMSAPFVGRAG